MAVAKNAVLEDIVGMRYILALVAVAFVAPVFGQEVKPSDAENPLTANWSRLGPTVAGARGFTLSGRGIRLNRSGQYELWVKIVPTDAAGFVRRYGLPQGTGYVLQYATVDCTKKLVLLERTAVFDSAHRTLEGKTSGITPSSARAAVKPGSIGETIFKYVCDDPTALPVNQNSQ